MRTAFTAIVAAVVIVLGLEVVKAQIVFSDGSIQTTAAGRSVPPPGAGYSEYAEVLGGTTFLAFPATPVPAGKELVIRQIEATATSTVLLSSRLPAPDQLSGALPLALVDVFADGFTYFADGCVVIDEGRQAHFHFKNDIEIWVEATVIGYYRDK